jgi:hypothetical protein
MSTMLFIIQSVILHIKNKMHQYFLVKRIQMIESKIELASACASVVLYLH